MTEQGQSDKEDKMTVADSAHVQLRAPNLAAQQQDAPNCMRTSCSTNHQLSSVSWFQQLPAPQLPMTQKARNLMVTYKRCTHTVRCTAIHRLYASRGAISNYNSYSCPVFNLKVTAGEVLSMQISKLVHELDPVFLHRQS